MLKKIYQWRFVQKLNHQETTVYFTPDVLNHCARSCAFDSAMPTASRTKYCIVLPYVIFFIDFKLNEDYYVFILVYAPFKGILVSTKRAGCRGDACGYHGNLAGARLVDIYRAVVV